MKRFTYWRNDHRVICAKRLTRDHKGDFTGPAVDQLAAYEDLEMSPKELLAQAGELGYVKAERDILQRRVKEQEQEIAALKSEREYFLSRAEFFREMAGVPMGFVGGKT